MPRQLTLLDLPREIRDDIYYHALTPPHDDYFFGMRVCRLYLKTRGTLAKVNIPGIALLRVSKQLSDEAAAVLYGRCTFLLIDAASLFLHTVGANNAGLIRHIMTSFVFGLTRDLGQDAGKKYNKRWRKRMGRAREHVARACTGLQTLGVMVGQATDFYQSHGPWDAALLVEAVKEIDSSIVRTRSGVSQDAPRVFLDIDGKMRALCAPGFTPVLDAASSLGWEVRRVHRRWSNDGNHFCITPRHVWVVGLWDVERNFDRGIYDDLGRPLAVIARDDAFEKLSLGE